MRRVRVMTIEDRLATHRAICRDVAPYYRRKYRDRWLAGMANRRAVSAAKGRPLSSGHRAEESRRDEG